MLLGEATRIPAQSRTGPVPAPAARSSWLPGALLVAGVVAVLWHYGVGPGVQARFGAQLVGVVLLPGILAWRALRPAGGSLPSDLVGGAALGYTMEIGWYLLGRAVGFPYLQVVAAAAVIVGFLAVPGLRRHWRGGGAPVGARWAWSVAGLCALVVAWETVTYLRPHGLTWPGYDDPYPDMVFHQALVGELRHHLPAQIPSVAGVPLRYHWFVHAEWAAASWNSGVEPFLLTYRLGLMPAVVLIVVAIAVVAQRIVPGRWWTGPLAAAFALFAMAPDPARWSLTAVPAADLPRTMWPSPTQTFGGLLFAGAVLALVDLLRADRRPGAGSWVAFALVLAGATGGKATYAPLLIAGLAAVVGVDLLRRRLNGRAVVAALLAALAFGIADLTMFRGTSAGLFVDPLASLATTYPRTPHPGWTVAHVAAIWLLGWAAVVGAGLILLWRRAWVDPMLPLCAGIGAAALAVVLLTKQMGGSQMYFLVSARPYVAVLVVAALAAVVPGVVAAVPGPGTPLPLRAVAAPGKRLPRVGWAVGEPGRCFPTARWVAAGLREHLPAAGFVGWAAAALGAAVTVAGEHASPGAAPPRGTVAILWPYALPVVVGLVVGGLLRALRWTRPVALVATLAVIVGAGVPTMIAYARFQLPRSGGAAARPDPTAPAPAVIPRGAIEAGRWLRAYTGVDDLLATNDHCRYATGVCDPRQFWLAAFGERRVLVEGWAFTPPANAIASRDRLGSNEIPYWDPAKLAANDAAFTHPTRAAVDRLHSRYGVTWLVVDTRRPADRASLARAATFRYQSGQVAIYQVK